MANQVSGKIKHICSVTHSPDEVGKYRPTVTIVENAWAYCKDGGSAGHVWTSIDPTAIADITYYVIHRAAASGAEKSQAAS